MNKAIQMRSKGSLTLPVELCRKYGQSRMCRWMGTRLTEQADVNISP